MKLLLKRPIPGGPPIERLIAWICGPYCHAEIQFADGQMFSSLAPNGVRFLSAADSFAELKAHADYWDIIALPWLETDEIRYWCEGEVGVGYDYRGALSSGFGLAVANSEKWFCSEISAEIVSRASGEKIPDLLCPTALGIWVDELLNGDSPDAIIAQIANRLINPSTFIQYVPGGCEDLWKSIIQGQVT